MKTRIRKKEYNNGKVEYICEKEYLTSEYLTCIILGTIWCPLIYFNDGMFDVNTNGDKYPNIFGFVFFSMFLMLFIYGIGGFYNRWDKISLLDSECIFDNLEDAKKFIDNELFKYNENKEKINGEKTKKTTIIKYP